MTKPEITVEFENAEVFSENTNQYNNGVPDTVPHNFDFLQVPTTHKRKLSSTSSNASERSFTSFVSTFSNGIADPWPYNHFATNYITSLLTVFYAVILIIYAVVLELSYQLADDNEPHQKKHWLKNFYAFNYYIYGVAFLFFGYCYIMVLLKPKRLRIFRYFRKKLCRQNSVQDSESEESEEEKYGTVMPNVGSLYLRLGAVVFAIVAAVNFSYSAYLRLVFEIDICSAIFTIVQTHFLFCSSTMFDTRHYLISKIGTMHLVATNLINWFQFLFIKTESTSTSLGKVYKINKTLPYYLTTTTVSASESSEEEVEEFTNDTLVRIARAASDAISTNASDVTCNQQMECVFGSFTKVFYTAVVEYSLIAAAVMFIVWHNIERAQDHQLTHRVKKKSTIRINCSKTIFGLFAGFGFLAGTFISMALFYGFSGLGRYYEAAKVFNVTDVVQHCIGIIACAFALWRIRLLNFVHHDPQSHDPHHAAHANQELLDMILLAIGLIGELMFSVSGLMGICNMRKWQSFATTLIAAHVSRIVQAVFQCCLICIASKLKVSSKRKHEQPGKQTITFLIIVNIAIFIMNLFESDKVGTSEAVVNFYGKENWVFLVRTFSPLTIFFRFHSSVCLAEIWKNTYATKH